MKITLNGFSMNYVERGMPNGLPVIFLHGFPFSHRMWEPQMPVLPQNIRAISYDVRGHGSSDVGDGQFTIEMFVDDLIALMDHLVIEKAVLCGLSMGGYIALRALERHPDRVLGMILCDTKSEADTNEAKIKRTATLKQVRTAGVQAFADDFVKSIFWEGSFTANPEAIGHIKAIILGNSPIGICGSLLALASRTDTTAALSSLRVPACLIVGEHDKLTPPSATELMHKAIPGSEMHIIPKAGHMSNLENTKEFNGVLTAFLRRHW